MIVVSNLLGLDGGLARCDRVEITISV